MEALTDFIFLGSQITVDGDGSHEIKTLARWKESYEKPREHVKKQRHHFDNKEHIRQSFCRIGRAMIYPVIKYRCERWIIKKAEHQGIDAFELWCWRRLLRVHWTAKRSNQSILKEINPEYSLEGLLLKLKLQNFGHLIGRADSLVKMLGKIEGKRRRGWQKIR